MQRSLAAGGLMAGAALLASTFALAGGPAFAKPAHTLRPASSSGGTIVDALSEEPVTLNPAVGHTGFEPIVEATMFENLFQILPNDQLTTVIAKTIPTVANGGISKNGLVYTFHLRHSVKWSNGQPFTAKDVQETWKLITTPSFQALATSGWSDVASMKIMDPYDFQLVLKKPDPALLVDAFSTESPGIIPYSVFHGMTGAQARTAKFNHDPTVTDGPFKFASWVPGASITVIRNPYWFGPKTKVSKIIFNIVSSQATILSDAQAHTINVYYFGSIDQLKQLQAIKGADVHIVVDPAWEAAYVNLRNPILRNIKVRQALEMGINRAGLVQSVWGGKAKLLAADQPPDSWSFDPNLKPLPYNPTEAKKLLEEAGYKMGPSGYMEKNGKTLSLIYATTSGISWRQSSEQLVQYWLKQIGVRITIHNEPAGAYFGTLLPSGKGWDLAEFQFGDTPDPAEVPLSVFGTGQGYNWENYSNPQVDKLFKAQGTATTQAARKKDLWQVEALLAKQLPALWYYAPEEIDTSINMTGYVPNPWATDTWNSYDWALTKTN